MCKCAADITLLYFQTTTDEESDPCPPASQGPPNKPLSGLLLAMLDNKDDDPQSIIDEHFNRVWHSSSTGQTPSRSPGRISPDRSLLTKSFQSNVSAVHYPSFTLPPPGKPGHLDTTFPAASKPHHRKKERDAGSSGMLSFDSGVAEDRLHEDYKHIQVHHRHYHHHHISSSSGKEGKGEGWQAGYGKATPARGGYNTERFNSTVVYEDKHRTRTAKDTTRQNTSNKRQDGQTGNPGVYDVSSLRVPNLHDPSNEK